MSVPFGPLTTMRARYAHPPGRERVFDVVRTDGGRLLAVDERDGVLLVERLGPCDVPIRELADERYERKEPA